MAPTENEHSLDLKAACAQIIQAGVDHDAIRTDWLPSRSTQPTNAVHTPPLQHLPSPLGVDMLDVGLPSRGFVVLAYPNEWGGGGGGLTWVVCSPSVVKPGCPPG